MYVSNFLWYVPAKIEKDITKIKRVTFFCEAQCSVLLCCSDVKCRIICSILCKFLCGVNADRECSDAIQRYSGHQ